MATWIGTMAFMPAVLAVAGTLPEGARQVAAAGVRAWYLRVGTAAMAATWVLGLTLLTWGGWMGAGWLNAKLVLVLGLSAVHGLLAGRLRRLAGGAAPRGTTPGWLMAGQLAALAAIAGLAVLKPF